MCIQWIRSALHALIFSFPKAVRLKRNLHILKSEIKFEANTYHQTGVFHVVLCL
jgi:hypothetical protein